MTDPRVNEEPDGGIDLYATTVDIAEERDFGEPESAFPGWTTFVSHRAVRAIAVAKESRTAWIATWGGVLAWNRGAQKVYRRYSSEHGLAGIPSCITVNANEQPWVGHAEGGLSYFENDRWWPYEHLRSVRVNAIAAATGGAVWVATPDAIFLVESGAPPVEVVRGVAECCDATVLLSDGDGVLIGSPSGLFRASPQRPAARVRADIIGECTALAHNTDGSVAAGTPNGIVFADGTIITAERGDSAITSLAPTRRGLWVMTRSHLARVIDGQWQSLPDRPQGVEAPRAIVPADSNDDYLWIGTDNLIVGARAVGDTPYDAGVLQSHPEDELNNIGRCAVSDKAGTTWIGTAGGLWVGPPDSAWRFDDTPGDVRCAIATTGGSDPGVWMLAWPAKLLHIRGGDTDWFPRTLPAGMPSALTSATDGRPCVLISSTIWRIRDADEVRVAENVPIGARFIAQAVDDNWFAGTDRGIFRHTAQGWLLEPKPGISNIAAFRTVGTTLWAGVEGAMWAYDGNGWKRYAVEIGDAPGPESVTIIAPSARDDGLWIASGGRVARYSVSTGTVQSVFDRFNSGICGRTITSIVESRGFLWIVSQNGIARYTLKQ